MKNIFLATIIITINTLVFSQDCWFGMRADSSYYYFSVFNNSKNVGADLSIGNNDHLWKEVKNDEGYYYIINSSCGLYLQPKGTTPQNGSKIIQATPNGSDIQQWKIIPAGDYSYYYIPKLNEDLYISVLGASVTLQPFNTNYSQRSYTGCACPFVYIKQNDDFLYIGEIIKNQISKTSDRYDYIEIPLNMITSNSLIIKVSEEKDEISYLDHIYLQVGNQIYNPETNIAILNQINKTDNNYYKMQKGESFELKFTLPENIGSEDKIKLFAKGYYIPTTYTVNK